MTESRNDRVRERAHRIWEEEGSPEGQESQHWEQAEREIEAEDAARMQDSPETTPKGKGRGKQGDA